MPLPSMCRILDNLPLVVPIKRVDQDSTVYQLGFHVGLKGQYSGVCLLFYKSTSVVANAIFFFLCLLCWNTQSKEEKFFIHNHLAFTVKYHRDSLTEAARIVGFEVKPFRSVCLCLFCSMNSFCQTSCGMHPYWFSILNDDFAVLNMNMKGNGMKRIVYQPVTLMLNIRLSTPILLKKLKRERKSSSHMMLNSWWDHLNKMVLVLLLLATLACISQVVKYMVCVDRIIYH